MADDPIPAGAATTTDDSLAYLLGRLSLLETAVATAVAARRAGCAAPDSPFRGVFLSDDQVDRLLTPAASSTSDTGTDMDTARAGAAVEAAADAAEAGGREIRLRGLRRRFDLDPLDVDLLMVALAPELDGRFERLYGYLHDDLTRRRVSVGLALELCGRPPTDPSGRWRLSDDGPLVRAGLVRVEAADRPLPGRSVRVPDRVVGYLLGSDAPDRAVAGLVVPCAPCLAGEPAALAGAVVGGARLCHLQETVEGGGRALAAAAYARLGAPVLALDLRLLGREADAAGVAARAVREARLRGAALVAGPIEVLAERAPAAVRVLAEGTWPVVLSGAGRWDPGWSREVPLTVRVPAPDPEARAATWRAVLGDGTVPEPGVAAAAVSFRLGPEQITRAATAAVLRAGYAGRPVAAEDLREGARAQNAAGLERHARRIEPRVGWQDLIVPGEVATVLRELGARLRWRDQVYGALGVRRGNEAVTALFAGPPGTGKSMAAEVLAGDLGLDLYIVDLARVVDKYIGETEKNLDRIFSEAEQVNGVLLFDEADALFGKRSEVRDAHDRYANVETAYLLQRMEAFDGIAVLTSNLSMNLDEAFARRLDAVVEFPMPGIPARQQLWDRLLGGVARADDLDLEFCAKAFEFSGGHIRNAAVAAAFFAAEAGRPVGMADLVRGVVREYRKLGRLCMPSEFGPYFDLVGP